MNLIIVAVPPLGLVWTLQANLIISAFLYVLPLGLSCKFTFLSQSRTGAFLKPEGPWHFLVVDHLTLGT